MSKISGQLLISGQLWNFRNFRTTGSPANNESSITDRGDSR